MNSIKTLPREPWRGSQVCGWQVYDGTASSTPAYCAARKADFRPACVEHYDDYSDDYGLTRWAPGNALGDLSVPVRLLWEPMDDLLPVVPTDEELARYAGILGLA